MDLLVDLAGRLLRDVLIARDLAAQEHGVLVVPEGDRTQRTHAPVADHVARDLGDLLDVAGRAAGNFPEHDLLGDAAAQAHGNLVEHALLRMGEDVPLRDEHRAAETAAARNDGDLVHGHVAVIEHGLHEGMARLVVGGQLLLLVIHQAAALATELHLLARIIDVDHLDLFLVAAAGEQGGLIQEIGQLGPGQAGRAAGDHGEVDIFRETDLAGMDPEDLLAAVEIGQVDVNLAVEAAGPQQRAVQHVRTVGRGNDDDALVGIESIHLHQQGIEGLLAFVVAAAETGAALAADGVDFIDEDQAGGVLAALLEHVAHAAGADADEHFDEIRTGNGEEGHVRFAGDRLGEQRFAGTRRPDHQDALGNASAHPGKLLGILEELHHLADLLLRFVTTRNIGERDLVPVPREQLGAALAETHGAATSLAQLPHKQKIQEADDQQEGNHLRRNLRPHRGRRLLGKDLGLLEALHAGIGQAARGAELERLLGIVRRHRHRFLELAGHHRPIASATGVGTNHAFLDPALFSQFNDLLHFECRGCTQPARRPIKQGKRRNGDGHPDQEYLRLKTIRR